MKECTMRTKSCTLLVSCVQHLVAITLVTGSSGPPNNPHLLDQLVSLQGLPYDSVSGMLTKSNNNGQPNVSSVSPLWIHVVEIKWSCARPACASRREMVWWTMPNFLGLFPKSGNDQWDCEITNCYVYCPYNSKFYRLSTQLSVPLSEQVWHKMIGRLHCQKRVC